MTISEFSEQFDVLYNNITSNQAPGLDEYEKSVFLTRAEKEIVKNYFSPNSKGNTLGQGFDDSAKRQADFSVLMQTATCTNILPSDTTNYPTARIDDRSLVYTFPADVFIIINEVVRVLSGSDVVRRLQVVPIRYDEYMRMMSKPFKRPLKNQAWRLLHSGDIATTGADINKAVKKAELIVNSWDEPAAASGSTPAQTLEYTTRYIRLPKPIILAELGTLTIDGEHTQSTKCEIDPILHEDILQRAVELAKIAWTATGQDNTNAVLAAGQRSE